MRKATQLLFFTFFLIFLHPAFSNDILTSLTDSVNSGIINTKVATDDLLSNTNIDSTVVNGIAIFSGKVKTQTQVNELVRIAHSVSGINGVDTSHLVVTNDKQ